MPEPIRYLGRPLGQQVAEMTSPVRCAHCGEIYDLGTVHVETRYLDCSVWKSPCCRLTVDDRIGWGLRHYYTIDKNDPWGHGK